MLQKANSNRMFITFLLQLHLRLNSLRLLHPNRPFRMKCQGFLRVPQSKSLLCHLCWQPSTEQEHCSDDDEEEELSSGFHELPHAPSGRLCSPSLCSCLCTLTLGSEKASGGSVPGRTTKTGGHWGPAVVEVRDNQDRSPACAKHIVFLVATTQFPVQLSIWLRSQRLKRATWWSAGEARKEKYKEKENTEHKNHWSQIYYIISEMQQKS